MSSSRRARSNKMARKYVCGRQGSAHSHCPAGTSAPPGGRGAAGGREGQRKPVLLWPPGLALIPSDPAPVVFHPLGPFLPSRQEIHQGASRDGFECYYWEREV